LKDSNLIFCRLAAQALTRIGPEALPALQQASQSSDKFVRQEAQWALSHLGQPTSGASIPEASDNSSSVTPGPFAPGLARAADPKATRRISLDPKKIGRTTTVNLGQSPL
jgi:HEAT repeat protein